MRLPATGDFEDFDFELDADFGFAAFVFFAAPLRFLAGLRAVSFVAPSPLTAAVLSSSAAVRAASLVAFGVSGSEATSSLPSALRSISDTSSSRYASR